MVRVRYAFEVAGALLMTTVFCLLPRSWAHHLGRRIGYLAYRFSARSRKVAIENLRQRLHVGEDEARRLAVLSHRASGAAVADMLRAPRLSKRVVRRDVEIPDATRKHVEAIRGGGGAVLACSHFGNWELANLCWPHISGSPSGLVVRPVPNPILNKMLFALRGWTGQEIIARRGAMRQCVRRVRAGGVVAITIDLPAMPGSAAEPIDFFGLPAYTTVAAGYFAAVAGVPAYLTHMLPIGKHRYRFIIEGPFTAPADVKTRAAAVALTTELTQALEATVRANPESWAWWVKRWRIRPKGAEGDFPFYSLDERSVPRP